ncbi:hypothetical protein YC2023_106536 [Brassica napus]
MASFSAVPSLLSVVACVFLLLSPASASESDHKLVARFELDLAAAACLFFGLDLLWRLDPADQAVNIGNLVVYCLITRQYNYQANEQVTLWVNKVGPYNNPQETYNYYSLPFCRKTENSIHKWGGLGEVLGGNELIDSQIDIKFTKDSLFVIFEIESLLSLSKELNLVCNELMLQYHHISIILTSV